MSHWPRILDSGLRRNDGGVSIATKVFDSDAAGP